MTNMGTVYDARISKRTLFNIPQAEILKHHLDVSDMVLERFGQILPKRAASCEQLMIVRLEVAGRKRNSQPGCESRLHLLPDMSF